MTKWSSLFDKLPRFFFLLLLLLTNGVVMTSWDIEPFDMTESIRSMGDSIYLKNEHVCEGDLHLSATDHWKLLERCTVIEGDLIIATFHKHCINATFPHLKEITGKFILYYTMMETLVMFPNLVVIRGREPLRGYSLIIVDNKLPNLHFPSLRVIQKGGVRISKNLELCYVETILWTKIVSDSQVDLAGYRNAEYDRDDRSIILLERNRGICPELCNESMRCPQRMVEAKKKELCWSPNVCQSVCDDVCDEKFLACWMNATNKCCHEECLGGCYGDGPELCVACKHLVYDKQCVRKCPDGLYEYLNRTCITKKKCFAKEAKDATGYRQNVSYSIFERRCVKRCPSLHRRNATTGICETCNDNCQKVCGVAQVYNLKATDRFFGCTSLRRLQISIRDGGNGDHMMEKLKRNFRELQVVEQSVRIINSGSLNSLAFLSNLRSIGVNSANHSEPEEEGVAGPRKNSGNFVFEVMANDGLEDLWTPKNKGTVAVYGRVRIYLNRKLCANKIFDFVDNHLDLKMGNLSAEERTITQKVNGDQMPCNVATINLTIMDATSRIAYVKYSQAFMGERSPHVTLLMIKPSEGNISLSEDRPGCLTSSWAIHEVRSCPAPRADNDVLGLEKYCVHSVDKLQPATRYAVFVERKTTQGDHGAISPVVYFTTKSEPPTPPRDIWITAPSSSSLKVRWRPPRNPNGRVERYFVWYRPLKLDKKQFARRNFCTDKAPMRHQLRGERNNMEKVTQRMNQNNTGYTCEQCRLLCPRDDKYFHVVDEVNFSFEDSLQNHIFVKRDVEPWDETGDQCFRTNMKVKLFWFKCQRLLREIGALNGPMTFGRSRPTKKPNVKGKRPFVLSNSSRSIESYEPYVTTSGDVRKSSSAGSNLGSQNASKKSESKVVTPDTPPIKAPEAMVPPALPTSPPIPKAPKEEEEPEKVYGMATVDANQSEIIISNLRHYTEYIVAIRACQEPRKDESPSSKGEGGGMFLPDESDEFPLPGYDNRVCSKKASSGFRTMADDRADALNDDDIKVNRENGLRVLWSRPPDPNGMILVYWFYYRRVDESGKKANPNSWIQSCVPLQTWYQTFQSLQMHRIEVQGDKRQNAATSPPVTQGETTNASAANVDPTPLTSDYSGDDQLEISYMEAVRGGYEFPQDTLSAGEYEFSIMAYSLAGNGSLTKVIRFRIGDKKPNPYELLYYLLLIPLVLVLVGLFACYRKNRDGPEVLFPNPEYPGLAPTDEWEISQEDIVYYNKRALGKGHFGVVVKGVVRNLQTPAASYVQKTDSVLAAIKTVRKGATYQEKMEFLSEANRMKAFHSEHIVKLLGVVSRMESRDAMPQVVLEFMCHGDMASYLKQISEEEAIDMLSEAKIMLWAAQIADGMAYLGHNRVVHRDLAARNCLVDANEVVKVSDFGLTRELYYQEYAYKKRKSRGGVIGPFMWMAPEALARGHFSYQSDVWSYGVVLWEIATLGARPYPTMTFNAVKNFVLGGSNLLHCQDLWDSSWKRRCPDSVMDLMRRCFAFSDKDRPTFMTILHSLETYMDDRFFQKSFYCQQQYVCDTPH